MEKKNDIPVQKAESEIYRIIKHLQLSTFENVPEIILDKFIKIYTKIHKSSKFRSPELLIPLIIDVYCKIHKIPINKLDLLSVSQISSTDFNDFIMQLKNFLRREMGD